MILEDKCLPMPKRRKIDENDSGELSDTKSNDTIDSMKSDSILKCKRKKISLVWTYFKKSKDEKFAKCNTCGKDYKTSGNTTNLLDHIKRFHRTLYNSNDKQIDSTNTSTNVSASTSTSVSTSMSTSVSTNTNTSTSTNTSINTNTSTSTSFTSQLNSNQTSSRSISPFFERSFQYDSTYHKKQELDQTLAMMIATDYQPYNIVNDVGFQKLVQLLDQKYVLPSKFTLREKIMKPLYLEGCNKLKQILHNINYIAIIADTWTSIATESYVTATCQFIDANFKLQTAVLSTRCLNKAHTPQNLADTMLEIFEEWQIKNKVVCVVTDNTANMVKMVEILKMQHLPCFAHTLNLVVQENLNLESIKSILNRCREIVTYMKRSSTATEMFKEEQNKHQKNKNEQNKHQENKDEQNKLSEKENPRKLIQDVSTRWNSTLYMLSRIIETKDSINQVLLKLKEAPSPLSMEEIIILYDMKECLEIFEMGTTKISGAQYVTISLIVPITFGIYNNLNRLVPKSEEGILLRSSLLTSIKKRLFPYETRSIPRIATIIDPRFKKAGFHVNDNANQAALFLEKEMLALMKKTSENEQNSPEKIILKKKSLFSFIDERKEMKMAQTVQVDVIISKRQYLERNNSPENTDPLLFWKVHAEQQPLPDLCRKYLCIPAISVEAERIFSKTQQIVSEKRSRIKSKDVDIIVFLNKNQWLFSYTIFFKHFLYSSFCIVFYLALNINYIQLLLIFSNKDDDYNSELKFRKESIIYR